ncbi:toll/interleukin-1 receptor (TIR) domain-containing protein [Artemisia annua]|uniref:ADP-ribosyl cyclase/cyclic ADP-ribose hydrolase n=1 Tax=Artemisia annua TaxID=35608 RepID=A0A2U1P9W8_ARTAN|nr:toll/interleukin-1 receptor (TIR) domain-containing protein [Artemisia annua]
MVQWLGPVSRKRRTATYGLRILFVSNQGFVMLKACRGKDTRLNFTDYLYEALVSENISTFLDEQEVDTGEELKPELTRAIKGSRASIIVLSKNYASSTWCLDELVLILEQRKIYKQIVLPIFYHVVPTHVRKQESSFGEALFKHRQRMKAEKDEEKKRQIARKLESWTKALKEVADLKGKDVNGRIEKEFIEEIVKEISRKLDIHMKSKIPHLIGRDRFLYTIRSWLHGGSSDTTEILTIWGMAGIGKTSLAKHIYLLYRHEFERSSFVEDIERRGQQSSALLQLQKKLLGDILKKRKIEEDDVQNCTSKTETALLQKRAFVVLDGVDDFEQVHALVGREGFHPGSRIIITTKDGSITDKALLHIKYPPKHTKLALDGLCSTDSLKLFCWHAFGGYSPKEGYEEDAKRASKYCEGHPLALKVLGSLLLNEDADTWSHTFTMLESREFQTNHVHKVLRIGFDSLPSGCKELFKDIACFFIGKETEVTEAILKDCGVHPSYGIKKLIERCLLTIGLGKELKMHQLLQDMGRDIVRQESPDKPWKRSRVWNHEESLNILQEDKLLGSLKYLNLSYSKLVTVGGFKELPSLESKLKNLPIIIRKLKNVKVLTLDGCGAGVFVKERKRMKLLNVPNKDGVSKKLQAFFSSITRLVLNSQKSISLSLPSSLVTLSLTNNNLSSESFPVDFSSMSMLKNLYLDCNPIDSIPDCLKSLGRLEVLSVGECSMLKSVICPSSTIKRLYVDDCDLLDKVTFDQEMSTPPLICCEKSESLTEIEGVLKIQDLAQMLYEFGIFSTWFPGKEVPKWFGHRSNGSSISFTMPSSSANKRIERINICSVYRILDDRLNGSKRIKVKNITKDRSWTYRGYMGAYGYAGKDLVWLSHWMFGNNELEAGDQVSVTVEESDSAKEDEASILNEFADEFRLPINQRLTENVDLDHVEQASLDTQLPSSNVGFRLLQKMGWKGKGLGKNEQVKTATVLADQDQRKALKFGFSSKFGGSKSSVKSAAKKPKVAVASVFAAELEGSSNITGAQTRETKTFVHRLLLKENRPQQPDTTPKRAKQ